MGSQGRRPRSYRELAAACFKHRWGVLLSSGALGIAVWLASVNQRPMFEAHAVLSIHSVDAAGSTADQAEELRLKLSSPTFLKDLFQSKEAESEFAAQISASNSGDLASRFRVSAADNSAAQTRINITFKDPDPDAACAFLSAVARLLVESDHSGSAAPGESFRKGTEEAGLQLRLKETIARREDLENHFPWLLSGARNDSDNTAIRRAVTTREEAPGQVSLDRLNDKAFMLEQQIADADRRVGAQRRIVEQQQKNPPLVDNATYAALIAKRTELQGQRDTLINRQELTAKHPRVVVIDDQIAAINRQIDELKRQQGGALSQSPEARELASLESERNRLVLELEITRREIARANSDTARTKHARATQPPRPPDVPVKGESRRPSQRATQQEYSELRQLEAELSARLESTRDSSGAQAARYELLQAPSRPGFPLGPSRWLLVTASALLGLLLGALVSLSLEARKFGIVQNVVDVNFYCGMPLLGSVPPTPTAAERRRSKLISLSRAAAAIALGAGATIVLARVLVLTDVLDRIANG